MNWRSLDLNLLVVFDAVAQTRSARRAADRLNMTQPAISHALTRLRAALRDDLFIRTPDGMEPTPYAARLAGPVRTALDHLGAALDGAAAFDPARSDRRFSIAVDNRSALVLVAPLAAAIAAEAPHIELRIVPRGTKDVAAELDREELDLVLGGVGAPGERFSDQFLFETAFAALVRSTHPIAAKGAVSLGDLSTHPHLILSSTGEETRFVDAALAEHGLSRRVAFTGPLLAALGVLAQSDMVAVLDERGARELTKVAPLTVLPLPFETPRLTTAMVWHRRQDDHPPHRWLRATVRRVAKAL